MVQLPKVRGAQVLDVSEFLENLPFGRFHLKLVVLSCLVTFFDGIDFGIIAYAAPYIRDQMQLSPEELGLVFSSSVVGQIIGAVICSYIADRIGRRPVILVCAVFAALFTIAMGFAANFEQLLIVRLLGGITIGGLLPVAWALNIESMPKARRATSVALIMFGFTLGGSFAGPITNFIAPEHGWEMVYFLAGGVTSVMALLLLPTLPESVHFLVKKRAKASQIDAMLVKFDPKFDPSKNSDYQLSDQKPEQGNFKPADLFRGRLAYITPLIWAAYFFSSIAAFLGAMWGPIFFEELGMSRGAAAWVVSSSALIGAIISVILLRFTEARGPKWVALFPLLATPLFLLVGIGAFGAGLVVPVIVAGMVLKYGGHGSVISIIGIFYPSSIRANAGGWASAIAKIGGVLGPMIGALFVTDSDSVLRAYLLLGICTLLVGFCVLGISRLAKGYDEN